MSLFSDFVYVDVWDVIHPQCFRWRKNSRGIEVNFRVSFLVFEQSLTKFPVMEQEDYVFNFNSSETVVYYESRKRKLKIRLMNEGRCDERLKSRVEESTCLTYTGLYDKTN
jgi:hypothetical protein